MQQAQPDMHRLVGGRLVAFVRGPGEGEWTWLAGTVAEAPAGAVVLATDDGEQRRLPLDPMALAPGRPGGIQIADTGTVVEADWVTYLDVDATGSLRPAVEVEPLVGQRVVVAISYVGDDGEELGHHQWVAEIDAVTPRGIAVKFSDGKRGSLPPDPTAFRGAARGEYRLESTGEVVVDPDLLSSWVVQGPPPGG